MPAPLTVHNAELRTATVEIKTLTVSGKQVTLAVFRQLRRAHLVDNDGNLRGEPWGTVNYHPDPQCREEEWPHIHVVWQDGQELRRAMVYRPNTQSDPLKPIWDQLVNLPQLFIAV